MLVKSTRLGLRLPSRPYTERQWLPVNESTSAHKSRKRHPLSCLTECSSGTNGCVHHANRGVETVNERLRKGQNGNRMNNRITRSFPTWLQMSHAKSGAHRWITPLPKNRIIEALRFKLSKATLKHTSLPCSSNTLGWDCTCLQRLLWVFNS